MGLLRVIQHDEREKEQRTTVMTEHPPGVDRQPRNEQPEHDQLEHGADHLGFGPRTRSEAPNGDRHPLVIAVIVTTVSLAIGAALVGIAFNMSAASMDGASTTASSGAATAIATNTATETSVAATIATTETSATGFAVVDVSDLVDATIDSVVTIDITATVRMGPREVESTGSGSGVILSEDGLIVTNAHVVEGADTVEVVLTDGSAYTAEVLSTDESIDLAFLAIDASGLDPITIGSSTNLQIGDPLVAIGNPLGLEGGPSVSTGIVSALHRDLGETSLSDVIQTDAAITEGSSGGALLDANGNLVGITTAVGVSSVGIEGMGFAIPVEVVTTALAAAA